MHSDIDSTAPAAEAATPPGTRRYDDLPGPKGVPVFGNAFQIETTRAHLIFEQWARHYGPYYKLQLGPRKIVVVSDHKAVAAALRDRPEGYSRTTRLEQIWTEMGLPGGVFGANGESWRRQRRMVMASFDPVHVRRYFPALQGVSERLAGRWQKAAAKGEAIDLQSDLMRFTVDTIAGLAFGAKVNTLESDEDRIQQHLDKIFPMLFKRIFAPIPLAPLVAQQRRSCVGTQHCRSDGRSARLCSAGPCPHGSQPGLAPVAGQPAGGHDCRRRPAR